MKIAVLLPSLKPTGPIIVAKEVIQEILDNYALNQKNEVKVFYFDYTDEKIELPCDAEKIEYRESYNFPGFDIVHSHGYRPDRYLSRNRNVIQAKTISTVHCHIFEDLSYTYNYFVSRIFGTKWLKSLKKIDTIVCLTNYHKQFYSNFLLKEKISVINNGRKLKVSSIDQEDIKIFKTIRERYPKAKIIGTCAAVGKLKGLDQILKTIVKNEDLVFVIIGDGPYKGILLKLAQKLAVEDRCIFLGYRSNASRYIKEFDIYALPSHSEAFPLALIEATLMKVPCVCSDIPVLKEAFSDEEVFFFELNNISSCKKAIAGAITSGQEKALKAYKHSSKEYTVSVMGGKYYREYQELVKA